MFKVKQKECYNEMSLSYNLITKDAFSMVQSALTNRVEQA